MLGVPPGWEITHFPKRRSWAESKNFGKKKINNNKSQQLLKAALSLSVPVCNKVIPLNSQRILFLPKSKTLGGNHISEGNASSFVLFFNPALGANNLSSLE